MSLAQVQDQAVPTRLLRNIITQGRIPNGLLFWGPEGVGKQYAALEFAKALSCQEGAGDACDECLSCRKITNGNHPDVKIIGPTSRSREILKAGIDFINDLASYRPFEANYRVIIIEEADRMRFEAQNHFLKTLEEPPSKTLFILMTASPRKLLPTIRSRCQQVRFGALQPETVKTLLSQHRAISPDIAEAIAAVSQGQMSRAFDLVDTDRRTIIADVLARLGDQEDPIILAAEFAKHLKAEAELIKSKIKTESQEEIDPKEMSKEDLEEQKQAQEALIRALIRRATMENLYLMETWYRDVLVFHNTNGSGRILNTDLTGQLSKVSPAKITEKFKAIEKAWLYTERNLSTDRVFRDLFCTLSE